MKWEFNRGTKITLLTILKAPAGVSAVKKAYYVSEYTKYPSASLKMGQKNRSATCVFCLNS